MVFIFRLLDSYQLGVAGSFVQGTSLAYCKAWPSACTAASTSSCLGALEHDLLRPKPCWSTNAEYLQAEHIDFERTNTPVKWKTFNLSQKRSEKHDNLAVIARLKCLKWSMVATANVPLQLWSTESKSHCMKAVYFSLLVMSDISFLFNQFLLGSSAQFKDFAFHPGHSHVCLHQSVTWISVSNTWRNKKTAHVSSKRFYPRRTTTSHVT